MYQKIFLLLITIILLVSNNSGAQSSHLVKIGVVDSVYSNILGESREVFIQLPESYRAGDDRKYPVIYVLDGDAILDAVATVYNYYWGGFMPEMVIVGISNQHHRTRDLTISKIEKRRGMPFNQEHGEAAKFIEFLEQELFSYVESKYPVTQYRTLIGHSYGGLFTLNALLYHTSLFANYLAIDPSLDWDDQKLVKDSKEIFDNKSFKNKSLFVSLSGQLHLQNSEISIDNVMQDTSEFTLFARSNLEFVRIVQSSENNEIDIHWKYYERDLHGTVPLPSILDGLIELFDWFQMENTDKFNDPETPLEDLLHIIEYREQKLAKHFGYAVPPYGEDLLNMLGHMNMEMGQLKKSLKFFQLGIYYFPLSPNVYDSIADYYASQNDLDKALENLKKAFELNSSDYYNNKIAELKKKITEKKKSQN